MYMVNNIYSQLKTPQSIESIHSRLIEVGVNWNLAQVKLFVSMDKNFKEHLGMWSIEDGDLSSKVLNFLDNMFSRNPKIPISIIMRKLPSDITIGKNELLKLIEDSLNYYTPNGVIICKKQ